MKAVAILGVTITIFGNDYRAHSYITDPQLAMDENKMGVLNGEYFSIVSSVLIVIILSFLLVFFEQSFNLDPITRLTEPEKSVKVSDHKEFHSSPLFDVPLQLDSKKSPLLYRISIKPEDRPASSIFPNETIIRRESHKQTTMRVLKEALSIQKNGYRFRIIVYAWKRRASLKRLLDSLLSASYHGFEVNLDFHMDGDAHPAVVQVVETFKWSHGKVRVHRHGDRFGLEKVL